tara:strand:+ start:1842 stop:2366 length:525 start_codon:yes stop_codon:yes gene_type:complete
MTVVNQPNTKGSLKSIDQKITGTTPHNIDFMFNPTSFTESRSADYNLSESQGQIFPLAQYVKVGNTNIKFSLFMFNHNSLKAQLQSLRRLTLPKKLSRLTYYEQVSPHKYLLSLGGIGAFTGVVQTCDINIIQYHRTTMDPIHLTADIDFVCVSSSLSGDVSHLRSITGVKTNG